MRNACALLSLALLPGFALADEPPSSLLQQPAPSDSAREPIKVGVRLGYFQQLDRGSVPWLNEDASVFSALILFDAPVSKTDRINATVATDVVSSASIRRDHNDTFRALQSEATGVVHVRGKLGWSHIEKAWSLALYGSGSWDYAYLSFGGGAKLSLKLLDDNASLRVGVRGYYDQLAMIRFNGEDDPDMVRWTATGEVGWTHILTPLTVLDVSLEHTAQGGFLAGQFNSVMVRTSEMAEILPTSRQRTTLSARIKQGIGQRHAIEAGVRYYHDDWGIDAGTAHFQYSVWLDRARAVLLRTGYRLHVQGAADAYRPSFENVADNMTSDPDLGDFWGHMATLGLTLEAPFGPNGGSLDFDANYYHRDSGLDMFWLTVGWNISF